MKGRRRRLVGKVTSNKMMKTVVVEVSTSQRHALYGKVVHKSARFKAHDEQGCQPGDRVRIVESRPLSREKRWAVEEILSRGYQAELPVEAPLEGAAPDADGSGPA